MNGLFNEVMSCAINRSLEFQNLDEAVRIFNHYQIDLIIGAWINDLAQTWEIEWDDQ